MPKAIWNGVTLAESSEGHVVEGNYYFPSQSIKREHLRSSMTHTTSPWKGGELLRHRGRREGEYGCSLVLSFAQGGQAHRRIPGLLEGSTGR
jgi:hypothetical protein